MASRISRVKRAVAVELYAVARMLGLVGFDARYCAEFKSELPAETTSLYEAVYRCTR